MAWLQNRFLLNKKIIVAQRGIKHGNMMKERRRQSSAWQKKKKDTLADSNYFYTNESIPCMNFRAHVTPFVCTLHGRNRARNL